MLLHKKDYKLTYYCVIRLIAQEVLIISILAQEGLFNSTVK